MRSSMCPLASIATILLLGTTTLAQLPKPVLFSDGLSPHVDQSFYDNLKPVESTFTFWVLDDIPQRCKEEAEYLGFKAVDFDVYSLKYTDCETTWQICRHKQAVLTRPIITNLFGRIPVHERQWIQHVVATPASNGNWAYMRSAVVVFVGNVGTPSVFQHEIGHAVDFFQLSVQSSATSTWDTAIRNDTCVPDDYANTSKVEDYAQNSVLLLYEIVTPGGLDKIGSWRCLQWQYRAIKAFQRATMIPGGTCQRRWTQSPPVPKASTALLKSLSATESEKLGLPPPDYAEPEVHRFKNLVFNKAAELEAVQLEKVWAQKARVKRMHRATAV